MNFRPRWMAAAPIAIAMLAAPAVSSADVLECYSRDYQYNFCATPSGVSDARLVEQRSRAACVEGRSWGHDRRGIWVSQGCQGLFDYTTHRPPPGPPAGGSIVSCESRDYRQEFCYTDFSIVGAAMVRQKSRTPCIQGQNWGWRPNGIWVSGGCDADFEVRTSYRPGPGPVGPGHVVCESREYAYNFCATGRMRDAQLVRQISQSPCIPGRTWGTTRDGIWVDGGCEAEFRVIPR